MRVTAKKAGAATTRDAPDRESSESSHETFDVFPRDTVPGWYAQNASHAGTMDYYVRLAVDEDILGIATTNAPPTMVPWGGVDKIIGLNPIGIGVPSGEGALVLNTALGATAHGKIRVFHQKGEPFPSDWAFDRKGRPATDAAAALHEPRRHDPSSTAGPDAPLHGVVSASAPSRASRWP